MAEISAYSPLSTSPIGKAGTSDPAGGTVIGVREKAKSSCLALTDSPVGLTLAFCARTSGPICITLSAATIGSPFVLS